MARPDKFEFIPRIDTEEKKLIYSDAIDFLYRFDPIIMGILPLYSIVICWGLWNSVSLITLAIFQAVVIFLVIIRYIIYRLYLTYNTDKEPLPWAYYHIAQSFVLGLVWAFSSYFFLEQASHYGHVFWIIGLIGNTVSAMPFLSYWYPSFFVYVFPSLVSLPLILFSYNTSEYQALAALTLMACLFILVVAYSAHFFIIDSISLRIQNLDLVRKLKKEKENAERSDQAKSRFLAAASHDLRQPLQALSLYLDALGSRLNNDRQYEILEKLQQSEQALSHLLSALLDVSKLDTGNLTIKKQAISCQDFIYNLSTEFKHQFEAKGIQFRVRTCKAYIYSDLTSLSRIIRNLLKNALRYTEQEGSVLFAVRCRAEYIEFQIWDTGLGIPEDKQKDIFDDFVQLHNYERHQDQGLGLGLSIVKRLAALLEHPIALRSKVSKGSVFSVQVPITEAPIMDRKQEDVFIQASLNTVMDKTILLIEDQDEVLKATVLLLESWGYTVVAAHDLAEIMENINVLSIYPDVIISDYRLVPPTTGIDVIHHLHEFYEDKIPALIITGDTSPEMLNTFKIASIPVLHKPIKPARLRTFLQRALASV